MLEPDDDDIHRTARKNFLKTLIRANLFAIATAKGPVGWKMRGGTRSVASGRTFVMQVLLNRVLFPAPRIAKVNIMSPLSRLLVVLVR